MRLFCLAVVAQITVFLLCPAPAPAKEPPRVGYEYWIPSSETDSATQHGIHFRQFVNGSAHRPRYPFSFQRWDEPLLGELNRRLGIDSLVAGSRDDLEAASRIALKDFARSSLALPSKREWSKPHDSALLR